MSVSDDGTKGIVKETFLSTLTITVYRKCRKKKTEQLRLTPVVSSGAEAGICGAESADCRLLPASRLSCLPVNYLDIWLNKKTSNSFPVIEGSCLFSSTSTFGIRNAENLDIA